MNIADVYVLADGTKIEVKDNSPLYRLIESLYKEQRRSEQDILNNLTALLYAKGEDVAAEIVDNVTADTLARKVAELEEQEEEAYRSEWREIKADEDYHSRKCEC